MPPLIRQQDVEVFNRKQHDIELNRNGYELRSFREHDLSSTVTGLIDSFYESVQTVGPKKAEGSYMHPGSEFALREADLPTANREVAELISATTDQSVETFSVTSRINYGGYDSSTLIFTLTVTETE